MKKNENEVLTFLRVKIMQFKILNIFKYIFYYFDKFILLFIKKHKNSDGKKKVLIIANLGLGDAMNFLSVAEKYRNLYNKEEYEITLLVPPGIDKILKSECHFDKIIAKNMNKILFNLQERIDMYKLVNEQKYEVLIDAMGITGASVDVYISNAVNAKEKITIVNKVDCICPKFLLKRVYTKICDINNETITNVELYDELVNFINGGKKEPIEFYKLKDYKINVELPEKYYIVFPSASADVKKWNEEKYAQIIEKIYNKIKLPVVFCGTKIDEESVNKVINKLSTPYYNVIGKTDILEFIQIIKQAQFVITNDTGAYHIALTQEIPVAIIVGGYTYYKHVTYNFEGNNYKKPYIITDKRDCFNCFSKCPYLKEGAKKYPCLDAVTVEYAWNIIEKMIDEIKE